MMKLTKRQLRRVIREVNESSEPVTLPIANGGSITLTSASRERLITLMMRAEYISRSQREAYLHGKIDSAT